jgi:LuxR family transcriptional regulator, maltose regulon positive regulatory protein
MHLIPTASASLLVTEHLTPSLILTKLQRPRAGSRLVARPHLVEQLDASHSLALVLAPADYGKTTLLSSWLETCTQPYAWLALDEHDDDLGVFVVYLIDAFRTLLPLSHNTLTAANGNTLPPPDLIARSLLNDLAAFLGMLHMLIDRGFAVIAFDYQEDERLEITPGSSRPVQAAST